MCLLHFPPLVASTTGVVCDPECSGLPRRGRRSGSGGSSTYWRDVTALRVAMAYAQELGGEVTALPVFGKLGDRHVDEEELAARPLRGTCGKSSSRASAMDPCSSTPWLTRRAPAGSRSPTTTALT